MKANRIQGYMFWPPDIPEDLDAAAIAAIHQTVANAFVAGPAGSPGPSASPTPTPGPIGC